MKKPMSQTAIPVVGMPAATAPRQRHSSPARRALPPIIPMLAIAAAYAVTGRLSLMLALPPGYATAIWPPAGIALAGVLLYGYRVWPGIVLGSFLVNIWTVLDTAKLIVTLAAIGAVSSIGIGAALQALFGAYVVCRFAGFPRSLDRDPDICRFLVLAGPISCLVNASIGVATLGVGGIIPWSLALFSWWTWWIGDTIGVLVITPLLLMWIAEPHQLWYRRRLSVAVPLVAVLVFTVAFFAYTETRERDRLSFSFERQAVTLARAIENSLDGYLYILRAIRSFYDSSSTIDRDEFRAYVQESLVSQAGIRALAWIPRVSEGDRARYEDTARQQGYIGFQITEVGAQDQMVQAARRAEYFPIYYIEPSVGNEGALGFDLASSPVHLAALHQVRDTGRPMAIQGFTLGQEASQPANFFILLPIYHNGGVPTTVDARRRLLRGFALGIFRFRDIVETTFHDFEHSGIALWIVDESVVEANHLLYSPSPEVLQAAHSTFDVVPGKNLADVQWHTTLDLAGHRWTLYFAPLLTYLAREQSWQPWGIRVGGLFLAGLLGAFLLVVTSRTTHIERLVAERTAELQHAVTARQREILARQRAQEALLEREARTRAIVETAVDGIITIDEQGIVESFNPAAERIFGYAAAEVVGQNIRMLMPSPYREEHDDYLGRYLSTGEKKIIGIGREVAGQRQDGTTFPMDLAVSELLVAGRQLFTGIVRDISEHKRAQEELARANAELRRSNQELEHFAYVASHDLKAPLRGIAQLVTWLEDDLAPRLNPDIQHKLTLLHSRVHRLETLLDDLLQYARVGRRTAVVKPVQTRTLILDLVTLLTPPAGFTITLAPDLPTFATAEEPLRQVLMNLLGNAIKHHDREVGRVEVGVQEQGSWYVFEVRDDGPGIPPALHAKVFQMFQTLKPRDEVEGSGIGLAIAKKVVEGQGGMIGIVSEAGQRGTTMRFTWRKHW